MGTQSAGSWELDRLVNVLYEPGPLMNASWHPDLLANDRMWVLAYRLSLRDVVRRPDNFMVDEIASPSGARDDEWKCDGLGAESHSATRSTYDH